jgi:hypothetical protein
LRAGRACGILGFGRGATAQGTEIPPKLELNLPPDQHATRKQAMAEKKKKAKKKTK